MQERTVPITQAEFQNLCDLHDEGIFMAHCGPWHKMEKKLVDIPNGGPDLLCEIRETKMMHSEDRRVFASRERELGGYGHVQDKIRICGGDQRGGSKVQVEVGVEVDAQSEKLVRNTDVVHDGG